MSRSATIRRILMDILREDNNERKVKFLLANAVLDGTLDPTRNERLLSGSSNGFGDAGASGEVVVLLDVAIRPLAEPEVHLGINELELFLDDINGVIRK